MKNIYSMNDYKESNSKKVSKPLGSSKMAELMTFFDIVNDKSTDDNTEEKLVLLN